MDQHTFPASNADRLEDAARRYRYLSAEELCWGVDVAEAGTVLDVGSGTGFYADDVAPLVDRLYALDLQPEMHEYYCRKGRPDNVELLTASAADLPLEDGVLDAAYATMTYHELPRAAIAELARVLAPGGRVVLADWSAEGRGKSGPPLDERFTADHAATTLGEEGVTVTHAATRTETFVVVGTAP